MIGYNVYHIYCEDIINFLSIVKRNKISIFHLHQIDEYNYTFMTYVFYRKKIMNLNFEIKYLRSSGILFYLTSFFHNRIAILGVVSFLLTYMYLDLFIWKVSIEGVSPSISNALEERLENYSLQLGARKKNTQQLAKIKDKVAHDFELDIDWLNLYLEGNTYQIRYTKKVETQIEEEDYNPIVACKAGVIDRIEVQEGNILVKLNQYVSAGEILVDNTIVASNGDIKVIPTKGTIFAYTWEIYEATLEDDTSDEAEAFSYLLDRIRNQVSKDMVKDFEIDKENVLQFTYNEGTISLKVHYTFLEDISCKRSAIDE